MLLKVETETNVFIHNTFREFKELAYVYVWSAGVKDNTTQRPTRHGAGDVLKLPVGTKPRFDAVEAGCAH